MSGYFWDDRLFENKKEYEEIREIMNSCLDKLTGERREFAIYRFGLDGQKEHSLHETAEHFSISAKKVRVLDCNLLRSLGIRIPTIRSENSPLNKFLEE